MKTKLKLNTSPIVNFVFGWSPTEMQDMQSQIMKMHCLPRAHCMKPVAFMKSKLGKQTLTWNGEFRFWVWNCDDWQVYVSDIQGITFEVREDMTKLQARAAWDDFFAKISV